MRKTSPWTIPNALTVLRLILTPFFVAALLARDLDRAWLLFLLAGLSDGLDGFLARVLDQRSTLGRILDPIADKLLLGAAYVCLGWVELLPAWLVVLAVGRDLVIMSGLFALHVRGIDIKSRIQPAFASKLNTLAQLCLAFLVLTEAAFQSEILGGLPRGALVMGVSLLTVLSGFQYVSEGLAINADYRSSRRGDRKGAADPSR